MVTKPSALVLCGDGINCEVETEFALELAGFNTTLIHTSHLLKQPRTLKQYHLLVLPGGFSFGDEIASGKVLAIKLKDHLQDLFQEFINRGSLLLASCNGFQVVVQMGLLPYSKTDWHNRASLVQNSSMRFSNRWVKMEVTSTVPCQFLSGLTTVELPMRHGEGRLLFDPSQAEHLKETACLRYSEDVNGSFDRIAALTNPKGNVLGLMPHPEGYVRWTQHPAWTHWKANGLAKQSQAQTLKFASDKLPDGLAIFNNAAKAICQG